MQGRPVCARRKARVAVLVSASARLAASFVEEAVQVCAVHLAPWDVDMAVTKRLLGFAVGTTSAVAAEVGAEAVASCIAVDRAAAIADEGNEVVEQRHTGCGHRRDPGGRKERTDCGE